MASSFRDLNGFAGISSNPLALLTAVLLKAHLTSQSVSAGHTKRNTIAALGPVLATEAWSASPAGKGGPLGPTLSSPDRKQVQGKVKNPGLPEAPQRQPIPAQHPRAHTYPGVASWSQRTWTSLPLNPHVLICKTEVASEKTH